MLNNRGSLCLDSTYHIYNRANGSEKIFRSDENYRFFLQQYQLYLTPFVDTFCYCFLPNHFHFLLRIKSEEEIGKYLEGLQTFPKFETLERFLSKQFSNLFSSYTQAYNKEQKRMGSLFMKNFNRLKVTEQQYLYNLVRYIHLNPVEANLCVRPEAWKHSSYAALISDEPTFLKRNEVIGWFDDQMNFKEFHSTQA